MRIVLEDEDREQRADRIVDDALPFQIRGGTALQACLAQQGDDHRRAGHDDDRAEGECHRPGQPAEIVRRCCAEREAQHHPECDQAHHPRAGLAQLMDAQCQPTLEQDHRDPGLDDRGEQRSEVAARLDPAEDRSDQHAEDGKQHDRRQPQPPGVPLGSHPQQGHESEENEDLFAREGAEVIIIRSGCGLPVIDHAAEACAKEPLARKRSLPLCCSFRGA